MTTNQLSSEVIKEIKKDLKKHFGSITEAKKQAKNKFRAYEKRVKEYNEKYSKSTRMTINRVKAMPERDFSINVNDYKFYFLDKELTLMPKTPGYYVEFKGAGFMYYNKLVFPAK